MSEPLRGGDFFFDSHCIVNGKGTEQIVIVPQTVK